MTVAQGGMLLSVDDAAANAHATILPIAVAHGLTGTLFVSPTHIGWAEIMTWAQVADFAGAGWTIANHTNTHPHLPTLTQAQQEAEFEDARAALAAQGYTTGRFVAYPYGESNAGTLLAMVASGMLIGRYPSSSPVVVPPASLYQVPNVALTDSSTPEAALATMDAWAETGHTVSFLFHSLDTAGEWTSAQFEAFAAGWESRSADVPSLTFADYYARCTAATEGYLDYPLQAACERRTVYTRPATAVLDSWLTTDNRIVYETVGVVNDAGYRYIGTRLAFAIRPPATGLMDF